jgi:hypothetical protein
MNPMGGTRFLDTTHDYLLAYGNPFIEQEKLKVGLPRVPDDSYTGSSAGAYINVLEDLNATSSSFAILRSARAYGIQGIDIAGGDNQAWSVPDDANGMIASMRLLRNRAIKNKAAYSKFAQVSKQQSAGRYVSSGVKLHDLGALQTQSGQILATHLGPDFIANMYNALYQGEWVPSDVLSANKNKYLLVANTLGLAAFIGMGQQPLVGGTSTDTTYTADPTDVLALIRQVADDNMVPLGNFYQEFVSADGCSLRTTTNGTARPFSTNAPPVIWHDYGVGSELDITTPGINRKMAANGYPNNDFWGDVVSPVLLETVMLAQPAFTGTGQTGWDLTDTQSIYKTNSEIDGFNFYYLQMTQQFTSKGVTTPVIATKVYNFLCDSQGIPIGAYRTANLIGLDNQGDAPFMYIQAVGQDASFTPGTPSGTTIVPGTVSPRAYKLYGASWEEVQPSAGSILASTPSPVDNSWKQVTHIASGFPSITKGFTFFGKLFDGVKDAAKFVTKNAGSIIRVGKLIGSAL